MPDRYSWIRFCALLARCRSRAPQAAWCGWPARRRRSQRNLPDTFALQTLPATRRTADPIRKLRLAAIIGDGFTVAVTRQNAGKSLKFGPCPSPRAGAVNWPASMVCAVVIVAFESVRLERLSHFVAASSAVNGMTAESALIVNTRSRVLFMTVLRLGTVAAVYDRRQTRQLPGCRGVLFLACRWPGCALRTRASL